MSFCHSLADLTIERGLVGHRGCDVRCSSEAVMYDALSGSQRSSRESLLKGRSFKYGWKGESVNSIGDFPMDPSGAGRRPLFSKL